jgi:general secretion pathway protein N
MTHTETMRKSAFRLALLLMAGFGVPASTSALPTDISDADADSRRADGLSGSSLWESPAAPATVVVKPAEPPATASERTPSANPLWAIPLANLSSTRERPIFSASRRPPPPAVASVPVAKAPPPPPKPARIERPQLSLVGTIAGDDQSFGIFVDQSTKAALRLKVGEEYQGWRLRSVGGREATLDRDQQTTLLSMPEPSSVAAGPMRAQAENALAQRPQGALGLQQGLEGSDSPPQRGGRR